MYSNHTTLNYRGQESKMCNVIFKQSQGHETWNDNVDPKQGYNQAKFERSRDNGVREKGNVKGVLFVCFFFKCENMSIISLNMCKNQNSGIFMMYVT